MILLAQNDVFLSVNVTTAFKFVTNMENYKQWFPGVVDIRSANKLAHGIVGKQYIEVLQLPQGIQELTIEVKESVENKHFTTEGDLEPLLPKMTMSFSKNNNNGCHFNLRYFSRNSALTENDELIVAIKNDLSKRIQSATIKLKSIIE